MIIDLTVRQRGTALGVVSYLIWGFSALYWVRTEPVSSLDVLAHRALWSAPVVLLILLWRGRLGSALAILRRPRSLGLMSASASVNALNWGIFLWAVTHERWACPFHSACTGLFARA